ncbi:hypothetical protein BC937DRAFT_94283 [Endogone sp. FLAS-F59071]|nr:hypothetical protein BC937DRAFT_94283 [Endogone sp. FLAS-F59071]|eukprot:RUS14138.1 hypothetical protein BC937DRAFT_94283 [Endogone sp. FLAS-F59071]
MTVATTFSHPVLPSKTPLDLPELLTLTFQFLAGDNKLYPTLFVNRQWHACASRILWRRVGFEESSVQLAQFEKFAEAFGGWKPERALGMAGNDEAEQPGQEQVFVAQSSASQRGNNTVTAQSSRSNVRFGGMSRERIGAPGYTSKDHHRPRSGLRFARRHSSSHIPIAAGITRGRAASLPAVPIIPWLSLRQKQPQAGEEVVNLDDLTISSPLSGHEPSPSLTLAALRVAPSLIHTYRSHLRALSLRKAKDKSINDPLLAIAKHARNLTSLDIYICDYLLDSTVLAFITIHHPISPITHLSLAGCHRITDAVVLKVAEHCPNLQHLDLRACGLVSDTSIIQIANSCPQLHHLNVGRIRERGRITAASILPLANQTQITVLGLAGCDVTDECMLAIAKCRGEVLERISVNNCPRITDRSLRSFVNHCKKLSVLELKECHNLADWGALAELVQRKVLLTMCETQKKQYENWAKVKGRPAKVRAPVK